MSERYNIKFSNVNLLDVMGRVVEDFTQFYKSDFDIDTATLRNATITPIEQDKTFIWLCRSMGTWLLRERDVFVTDTREHKTVCFYWEQMNEPILRVFRINPQVINEILRHLLRAGRILDITGIGI